VDGALEREREFWRLAALFLFISPRQEVIPEEETLSLSYIPLPHSEKESLECGEVHHLIKILASSFSLFFLLSKIRN
jgi:hypothetical protein